LSGHEVQATVLACKQSIHCHNHNCTNVQINVCLCVIASRHVVQVSPISNVGQKEQPASQQGDCGYSGAILPLVIDLEDSSDAPDGVASTSMPSAVLTQTVEQPLQHLNTAEIPVQLVSITDHSTVPESTVIREVTAVTESESATAVDLTVAKQRRLIATETSVSIQSCSTLDSGVTSADSLSDEYKKRYEKYENLCMLITLKDRELAELNDERKRLHQLLVDLQRSILARPVAITATAIADMAFDDGAPTAPPNTTEAVEDADREKDRDESAQDKVAATTVAYRRRPAHRGVTSVRVMVKSTHPPTAHSTKINLSRYNSLFCNYDDATAHRKRSTDVAVASEDVACGIQATDLTSGGSERATKYDDATEEVVRPPASTMVPEKLCCDLDGTTSFLRTKADRRSEDIDAGNDRRVVSDAVPTIQGVVQYQRRPDDVCQTSIMSVLESYPTRHETAGVVAAQSITVGHDRAPSDAYIVPEDSQRAARQIADVARHQQFVLTTTGETILSSARPKRDISDQRSVVLSTMRPELSLVLTSSEKYHPAGAGAEPELSPRSAYQHRELRPPPPPYPHRRSDLPQSYAPMAASGLSPREQAAGIQSSHSQLDHSVAPTATCAYWKENSAGPRTVYVQPMRAENQATTVIQPSSDCTGKEVDVLVLRQPCSDIPPSGYVVSEAMLLSSRMSPPALPLRTGVRTTYNQRPTDNIHESVGVEQTQYLHHVAADMAQPRPRNVASYHGNRLSNPQTLDAAPQQLTYPTPPNTTNAEQRYATMTLSSAARDVVNRHEVDRRPLDQLQHFVDGQRRPLPDQLALDTSDPRLRPPSPGLMTSGHLNNVDGRSHIPTVGVDYLHQDSAAVPVMRVGDCVAITEADFSRRGVYHTAHPSGFAARAGAPPQRYRNPCQAVPPRGPPRSGAVGPAPAPLDMSGAKRRRYSSLNKVIAAFCRLSTLNRYVYLYILSS